MGDLVMLSVAGKKIKMNRRVLESNGGKELGIITRIFTHCGTDLYTVNWMEYNGNFCPRHYRRELRFAR